MKKVPMVTGIDEQKSLYFSSRAFGSKGEGSSAVVPISRVSELKTAPVPPGEVILCRKVSGFKGLADHRAKVAGVDEPVGRLLPEGQGRRGHAPEVEAVVVGGGEPGVIPSAGAAAEADTLPGAAPALFRYRNAVAEFSAGGEKPGILQNPFDAESGSPPVDAGKNFPSG